MLDCLTYVEGFFDGPGQTLLLPTNDVVIVACGIVSCLLYMCMDGKGLFEVLLVSLPQGP